MKTIKQAKRLLRDAKVPFSCNCSLKPYTSLHIGGKAALLIEAYTLKQIKDSILIAKQCALPYYILGNGSNVLIDEEGYAGCMILLRNYNRIVQREEERVRVQSGMTLKALCDWCLDHELSGLEFACGIPGSVGGGVVMNAGAYGGEKKDVVTRVWYLDPQGEIQIKEREALDFAYRHSCFSHQEGIILEVEFQLHKGKQQEIKAKMEELNERRRYKQPLAHYSAGSVFKRPPNSYASLLIAQAGLQGKHVGDACVSTKHAGFLINLHEASAYDFLTLIKLVQTAVYAKSGIWLECEIIQITPNNTFG